MSRGLGDVYKRQNKALVFDLNQYIISAQEELYEVLSDFKTKSNVDLQLDWGKYDIDHLELHNDGIDLLLKPVSYTHLTLPTKA